MSIKTRSSPTEKATCVAENWYDIIESDIDDGNVSSRIENENELDHEKESSCHKVITKINEKKKDEIEDSDESVSQSDCLTSSIFNKDVTRTSVDNANKKRTEASSNASVSKSSDEKQLRSPILCVLGHVNAGKTTILDRLRRTNVQKKEAGGITQQIGATFLPMEIIFKNQTSRQQISSKKRPKIPGLLLVDTPGHESFKNIRARGSSLCDFVILVVDIFHGLEAQTIESIRLLTERQIPFIIALNKIDLIYGWQQNPKKRFEILLETQSQTAKNQFQKLVNNIVTEFAIQHINAALFYENSNLDEFSSMVPVSGKTGDGLNSLIAEIFRRSETQLMAQLQPTNQFEANVLEVKLIHGLGTVVDIVLINGSLAVGNRIYLTDHDGRKVREVRGLMIPAASEDLRATKQFKNVQHASAVCGLRIIAKDLSGVMAGSPILLCDQQDEDDVRCLNDQDFDQQLPQSSFDLVEQGVHVQASTQGSLEALLDLLKKSQIPYASVNIGPVRRKDVMRAHAQTDKGPELAAILAFDVPVDKEMEKYAAKLSKLTKQMRLKTCGIVLKVKIFQENEIYQLATKFHNYRKQIEQENREKYRQSAIFPCRLRILDYFVFNRRDPLVCGVIVEEGTLKIGTPICIPSKDFIDLGYVTSIESNHKSLQMARKKSEVCVKIELPDGNSTRKIYGRHFDHHDLLVSNISRFSIDVLEKYFREEIQPEDQTLLIQLKTVFGIAD